MTSPDRVRTALREVVDPCSAAAGTDLDIVEMGLVESVEVDGGTVHVDMRVTTPACTMVAYFLHEIETHVEPLPGVREVTVSVDAGFEWSEEMLSDDARRRREDLLERRRYAYAVDREGEEPDRPAVGEGG